MVRNDKQVSMMADEYGEHGMKTDGPKGKRSSKTIIIAITETDDPEEFSKIAARYPANTRAGVKPSKYDELKFDTSSDDARFSVISDIASLNPKIYTVKYVKKPEKQPKGGYLYRGIFREAFEMAVRNTDAEELIVLIDDCTQLNRNAGVKIVRDVVSESDKSLVKCIQARSHEEYLLIVHDFVVGAIGYEEEYGDDMFSRPLKGRMMAEEYKGTRRP